MSTESARKAAERYTRDATNKHCIHDNDTGALIFFHSLRENEDKAITDFLAAACQTVAPPPNPLQPAIDAAKRIVSGENKVCIHGTPLGAAPAVSTPPLTVGEPCPTCNREYHGKMGPGDYSCAVCGMGMIEPCEHWKAMQAEAATISSEPMAVSTPRCPVCRSVDLLYARGTVLCNSCAASCSPQKLESFAQFFQPAPAQPRKPGNVIALEVAMRLCREGLVDVAETGLVASAIFEYCFPDEFKELNPPVASPQGVKESGL